MHIITDERDGSSWHPECVTSSVCSRILTIASVKSTDAKTHPQRSICAHSAPVSLSLACQFVSIGNLPRSTVYTNHNMTPFSSTCHYSDASIIRDEELNSKSAWSHALPLFNKCPAAVARLL